MSTNGHTSRRNIYMSCNVYEVGLEVSLLSLQFSFVISFFFFFKKYSNWKSFYLKYFFFHYPKTLLCFLHFLLLGTKGRLDVNRKNIYFPFFEDRASFFSFTFLFGIKRISYQNGIFCSQYFFGYVFYYQKYFQNTFGLYSNTN